MNKFVITAILFISWQLNAQVALPTFQAAHYPGSPLYSFSSHTFTNCSATGKTGPTLANCKSSYDTSWEDDTDFFNVQTQGIQEWTVPTTGTYRIEAYGAQGGPASDGGKVGGKGARIRGDFTLTKGDVIKIVVGQMGETTSDDEGSGGGGGSFVVKTPYNSNSSILVIAGGGGGSYDGYNGLSGLTGTSGGDSYPSGNGGSGGSSGSGGTYSGSSIGGSGGGGFLSAGYNAPSRSSYGGKAFTSNPTGGDGSSDGDGGYGGGGGGSTNCGYGGGGGGYSGGGGAGWKSTCGGSGGGGGSYNSGSNTSNSEGVRESHGQVIITLQ